MPRLLIHFILATTFVSIATSCFFTPKWKVYITNATPDNIVVHVRSKDDDLGNHTLPSSGEYDFSFCDSFLGTSRFNGEFWWGQKYQILDVLARSKCQRFGFRVYDCYWLVRPDGFYVSTLNISFPDPLWSFYKAWG
ncbi:putative plant self-incompatibility S1 [Helianthus annuus]|nr:putative plant self-incompatibility S1 [Helianthus annuus]